MQTEAEKIKAHFEEAAACLNLFVQDPENFRKIEDAARIMVAALQKGNKIISCGNGGSMCDAMHFAEELSGRYRTDRKSLAAISISDPSFITCTGNDYGFDHIFSRFIEGVGKEGDVLLAISTSGNSRNVVSAAQAAAKRSIPVIALTGKDGGQLAGLSTIEIRAPFSKWADRVQEIHIKIIHSLINCIEQSV